ncbi:hypothetical protein [Streptomyces altiplanensis]
MTGPAVTGDDLVRVLATLSDPHRLRVAAALAGGRNYITATSADSRASWVPAVRFFRSV